MADTELRVEMVTAHLAGLAFARYQLRIEPIASAKCRRPGRLGRADRAALPYRSEPVVALPSRGRHRRCLADPGIRSPAPT